MKCVFVTGATGVLGSALAPLFLEEPDTRIVLLMRAESMQDLKHRLSGLLAFWDIDPRDADKTGRIEAVCGDVSVAKFGFDPEVFARLAHEVTHIVHAAGDVKLNRPLDLAKRSAVDGAKNVFHFAKECIQSGQFQKIEFVSTVGVAGSTPGLIDERPYNEPRRFHNTYEAAKAEAESLAWSELASGITGTIHRPSMIVGDSKTGKTIRYQVFYHLADFLTGIKTWGFVPRTGDTRLDIIPVDYVARAIYLSSRDFSTSGSIFHLASGPERSWTLDRLVSHLRQLREKRQLRVPKLRKLSPSVARSVYRAAALLVTDKRRRFLKGLPFFLDYLDDGQVFVNSKANAAFSKAGLIVPRVDDYLDTVINAFWNASGKLKPQ